MKRIGYIDGRRIAGFTFAGASALDGMKLTISDITTNISGSNKGIYINYASSGIHASGGEAQGLAIDMAVTGNISIASCITLYQAPIANKTIDGVYGIDFYLDDVGTACNRFYSLNLGQNHAHAAAESGFLRMRNHGSVPLNAIFRIEANNPATYLLRLGAGTPYSSADVTVKSGKIAVDYNGTPMYIQLYSS